MELLRKIAARTAKASVIGLGYVGLPLAIEFAEAGYEVFGIDSDLQKTAQLKQGKSYLMDIDSKAVETLVKDAVFHPGTDYAVLSHVDIVVICVPTPLGDDRQPDTSYIESAVVQLTRYVNRGTLVILESTTYPGTTELLIRNRIEQEKGWEAGEDFFVCFSPERVDPGIKHFDLKSTPKVIGGSTTGCLSVGKAFYATIFQQVVPVSSNETAELAKLFENTFRNVNIALVNEMAPLCERMGVSIWEVLDAAATKPFGYLPFYPGPGIGGHCIPVDPLYLSWKSQKLGIRLKFIELADETNRRMPGYVVERTEQLLNARSKSISGAHIIISGIAYKKDIDDIRESPSLELLRLLRNKGAIVEYYDPYVASCTVEGETFLSQTVDPQLWSQADLTIIATDHTAVDYQQMVDYSTQILDTRNATKSCNGGCIAVLGSSNRTGVAGCDA